MVLSALALRVVRSCKMQASYTAVLWHYGDGLTTDAVPAVTVTAREQWGAHFMYNCISL